MDENKYSPQETEKDIVNEAPNTAYAHDDGQHYTYADYISWDDDQRWELIDGVPYLMSAPTTRHADVSDNLFVLLANLLKGKPCRPYHAPRDVRLNADTLDNTVVQPDIFVLCDRGKLDKTSCRGVPDFVVEVLSPSTSSRDRTVKFELYKKAGVREYWIVDPDDKLVFAQTLKDGDYITRVYSETDIVPITAIDGCMIDLAEVFEEWVDDNKYELPEMDEDIVSEAIPASAYAKDDDRRYTYADYMSWDDDQRWELIDGVPYLMSAPTMHHALISSNLLGELHIQLKGKQCRPFHAPFDVRLNADTFDNTVVQPDVLVLCDREKYDKTGCKGAPDFVVEVLSPSTSSRDRKTKFNLYKQAGVREYWIIDPDEKLVFAHIFNNEDCITRIYKKTDIIPITALEGCMIDLAEVFNGLFED